MPASIKQTTPETADFQVGCYTLHGSLTSPYKAGFLAPESMFSFPFSYICTMVSERLLLCYSDRIAQDFHLIPFSDCFAENSQHFICSIWNYTDIILPHLYINVKEFQTKFLHFLNFSYCSHRTIQRGILTYFTNLQACAEMKKLWIQKWINNYGFHLMIQFRTKNCKYY